MSFHETIENKNWKNAIDEEIKAIKKNDPWELVSLLNLSMVGESYCWTCGLSYLKKWYTLCIIISCQIKFDSCHHLEHRVVGGTHKAASEEEEQMGDTTDIGKKQNRDLPL
ncbi:hypothetical protein HKD37_15G043872 [Glycine soja]